MNADDFLPQAPGHLVVIPEGVKGFVPDPLPPPGFSIAPCCLLAEQAAMALGGLKNLVETLPNAELLIGTFLRREALRSSKIEGTHTKLGQLLLFELGELPDVDGQQEDAEQVNRNFQAFQFGIKRVSELPVCGRLFREIHAVLFEGANPLTKRPGEFRNVSAMVGTQYSTPRESFARARFVAPPQEQVPAAIADLENFLNIPEQHEHLPVLIQLALLHYQFETIHPFMDGNGRIGRLAVSLLLMERGLLPQPILCLSAYMDDNRDAYVDSLLTVSQKGDWLNWVNFFLRGVKEQADDDCKRCKRLLDTYQSDLANGAKAKVPPTLIESLFRYPITTISNVSESEKVAFTTAQRYVETLEKAGILKEVTGRSTHRIYLAQQVIDLLELPLKAS